MSQKMRANEGVSIQAQKREFYNEMNDFTSSTLPMNHEGTILVHPVMGQTEKFSNGEQPTAQFTQTLSR